MKKRFFMMPALAASVLLSLCSCSSTDGSMFSDKLTVGEKNDLMNHARRFLVAQRTKLLLSERDVISIQKTPPVVKEYYSGRKEGKISFSWSCKDIRKGKVFEAKVVKAILEGDLIEARNWRVSIIKNDNVNILANPTRPGQLKTLTPQDFEQLRKQ